MRVAKQVLRAANEMIRHARNTHRPFAMLVKRSWTGQFESLSID
jgi:hypothetical protein